MESSASRGDTSRDFLDSQKVLHFIPGISEDAAIGEPVLPDLPRAAHELDPDLVHIDYSRILAGGKPVYEGETLPALCSA